MQEFIIKNLITILVILLFVYNVIRGFSMGFLQKLFSLGSLILTIIFTKVFTPIFSNIVKDYTNAEATISDWVYSKFIDTNIFNDLKVTSIGKALNIGDINQTIKDEICSKWADVIINLLCGIVVFLATFFLIKFLVKVLDFIDYVPIIGQFNKILGGAVGAVESILIIWIIFSILHIAEGIPEVANIVNKIEKSTFTGYLYSNNIIYSFFSNLFKF